MYVNIKIMYIDKFELTNYNSRESIKAGEASKTHNYEQTSKKNTNLESSNNNSVVDVILKYTSSSWHYNLNQTLPPSNSFVMRSCRAS